jgi:hypothetical protein
MPHLSPCGWHAPSVVLYAYANMAGRHELVLRYSEMVTYPL